MIISYGLFGGQPRNSFYFLCVFSLLTDKRILSNKKFILVEPDSRVVRECGSNLTEIRPECYAKHGIAAHQTICECDISYCNGVGRTGSSISMNIILVILFIVLMKNYMECWKKRIAKQLASSLKRIKRKQENVYLIFDDIKQTSLNNLILLSYQNLVLFHIYSKEIEFASLNNKTISYHNAQRGICLDFKCVQRSYTFR